MFMEFDKDCKNNDPLTATKFAKKKCEIKQWLQVLNSNVCLRTECYTIVNPIEVHWFFIHKIYVTNVKQILPRAVSFPRKLNLNFKRVRHVAKNRYAPCFCAGAVVRSSNRLYLIFFISFTQNYYSFDWIASHKTSCTLYNIFTRYIFLSTRPLYPRRKRLSYSDRFYRSLEIFTENFVLLDDIHTYIHI